mmetsp:Transcript_45567/g.116569  ORF Transcript_45567/g.116569 Transcript_45567/m.116569 type:complete len:205 (+) Transcript_45567:382-996(+)
MATRLREKAGALPARRLVEGTIELGGITPVAADDTVVIVVLAVHILAKLEVVELDPSGAGAVPGIPPAGGHADLVAIALDVHLVVVTGQHEILPKEGRVLFEELMLGAATAVLLAVLILARLGAHRHFVSISAQAHPAAVAVCWPNHVVTDAGNANAPHRARRASGPLLSRRRPIKLAWPAVAVIVYQCERRHSDEDRVGNAEE